MSTIKQISFAAILLVACIFAGCVSVQGLYVDPSFTYQSVLENNIGVGGVVSATRKIPSSQQTAFSNLIQDALIKHFPGLPVMPAGDAVRAIGVARYDAMMEYYRRHGVVPDQYLDALYQHIIYMRYIVFARVEQERISYHRTQDEDAGTAYNDSVSTINFITTLTLRLHMDVYDVKARQIVWRGSVSESNSRSNSYDVPSMVMGEHVGMKRVVVGMVGNAIIDAHHSYPTAPGFYNLMQRILTEMVDQFPKRVQPH